MIVITKKSDCCGCWACAQCCPKQCISMDEDSEGFLYPKVDASLCIDCKLCEKV
ncbi:MAG: F420H(2):quinone oxidoreductase, partial [Muribaculaceae bacterium]